MSRNTHLLSPAQIFGNVKLSCCVLLNRLPNFTYVNLSKNKLTETRPNWILMKMLGFYSLNITEVCFVMASLFAKPWCVNPKWCEGSSSTMTGTAHDDVMKWKHFSCYWSFALPSQRPVRRSFYVFLWYPPEQTPERMSKQSGHRWFETPSRS